MAQYFVYLTDVTNAKKNEEKSEEKKKKKEEEDEWSESTSKYLTEEDAAFHVRIGIKLAQEILSNPTGMKFLSNCH